jgi:hypothetical protein
MISKKGHITLHFLCYQHDFSYLHRAIMVQVGGKTCILQIAKHFNNIIKNIKTKDLNNKLTHVHCSQICIKFTTTSW